MVDDVWKNLFAHIVALKMPVTQFNPDAPLVADAVNGRLIPPVPGLRYFVLAGTKPLTFNVGFFTVSTEPLLKLYTPNDGMITTQSAFTLGDEAFNDPCNNYYEVNLDHLELNDHELARQIIQHIVNQQFHDAAPEEDYPGYSKYVNFKGEGWQIDDLYLIVSKKLPSGAQPAVLDCACGNSVCGEGENVLNCPSDCYTAGYNTFCVMAPGWITLLLLLGFIVLGAHMYHKQRTHKENALLHRSLYIIIAVIIILALLVFIICKEFPLITLLLAIILFALTYFENKWQPKGEARPFRKAVGKHPKGPGLPLPPLQPPKPLPPRENTNELLEETRRLADELKKLR